MATRALERAEFDALLTAIPLLFNVPVAERLRAMLMLMAGTGLRIGEACALRVEDVSSGGRVGQQMYLPRRTSKTKRHGDHIALLPEVQAALQRWLDYSGAAARPARDWLFPPVRCSRSGRPLFDWTRHVGTTTVRDKGLKVALAHLRISGSVSCHSLRKLFAAEVCESCHGHMWTVQGALRHDQIRSTEHYVAPRQSAVDAAIRGIGLFGHAA